MLGHLIRSMTTVLGALAGGAVIGSLFNGFGHYRHLYCGNDKKRSSELKRLEQEDSAQLKKRIIIGCVLGAFIGTATGVLLSQINSLDDEE